MGTHAPSLARTFLAATVACLALAACGSSGSDGPAGPPGPPGPFIPPVIGPGEPLPGVNVVVVALAGGSGPAGRFQVGDVMSVTFTVKTDDGIDLDVADLEGGEAYVSGPTSNYQRVIPQKTDVRARSVNNGDGTWTYAFLDPIPAVYAAPYNDSPSFGPADGELAGEALLDGTYTLGLHLWKDYDLEGETFRDPGSVTRDFLFGAATVLEARAVVGTDNCNVCHTELYAHGKSHRQGVGLCVLCHTSGAEDNNNPAIAGGTPGVSIDFRVLIHKLHNAAHLPSVLGVKATLAGSLDYTVAPEALEYAGGSSAHDFSEIVFPVWPNFNVAMPRDAGYSALSSTDPDGAGPLLSPRGRADTVRTGITACGKCHGDPDAAGPLGAPADGDNYRTAPSRQACGSCHDDIVWTSPYTANGQTMPANVANDSCSLCHSDVAANQPVPAYESLAITEAHLHPLLDPSLDPGVNTVITAVTGGTGAGGKFQVGDSPSVTFTLKNDAGADIGLATMDAGSTFFMGPTTNRQLVTPLPSPNGMSLSPFDFAGRLHAVSGSNKGTMSKVVLGGTAVAETLVVQFTSTTAFTVTGTTTGALGGGALPASPSTNPSGSSVSALELSPALGSETVQVAFSSATAFAVTGSVSGAMGGGVLPASTNASTRFTSASLSFNVSVGTTPFAAGNTVHIAVFRGAPANPVLFAIVAGRTSFSATAGAPDRFYYEVVPNAASYTLKIPMDLVYEFLGDSTNSTGQVLPAAGNLPVYYGRQQLWEASTVGNPSTTTTAAVAALGRYVDVSPVAGLLNGDLVAIDPAAGVGVREYALIAPARADGVVQASASGSPPGDPSGSAVRLWFKTPLRYAHAAGVTITKATLVFKQEGAGNAYTLDPATGVVTCSATTPFTASRGLVMSYRTDGRFGYRRHGGDAIQAYHVPPANDSADIGQEQGEWQGLPYANGTYTADLWLTKNIDLGLQNEMQTYRSTSYAGTKDFLYGSATEIVPHAIISASENCYRCHNDLIFHGGGRRGLDACLTCHSISGNEDKGRWDTPNQANKAPATVPTELTTGVAIEFRQMLHKIHKGAELAHADTYTVVGNGGNSSQYGEVEFPAWPGGVRQCVKCHGNEAWHAPAERSHPSATLPTRVWTSVCGSCHDADDAQAHIIANVAANGVESCEVCHGAGRVADVVKVHFPR